jgi:O-antigen ligase
MRTYKISLYKLFSFFEKTLIILVLFYATTPQTLFLGNNSVSLSEGNPISQLIWGFFYICFLFLILLRMTPFINNFLKDKLLLLLIVFAIISIMWSEHPDITLRKSVALFLTTIIGIYIGMRLDSEEQLKLIAFTLSIVAILSLLVVILFPDLGIQPTRLHEWRGIYHQKGPLGRFMALGAIALLILMISGKKFSVIKSVMFVTLLFLMFKAGSITAIVSFGVIAGSIIILRYYWKRWRLDLIASLTIFTFVVIAIIGLIVISQADVVTSLVGKNTTLSGRTSLWSDILELSKDRFLLGYGYNGFWLGWNGPSASIWLTNLWEPTHAHNGFLDVLLDLGIIGLSLLLLHLFLNIIRSFRYIKLGAGDYTYLWPVLYLQYILINSLTQSVLLTQNSIFWIIYVAITTNFLVVFSKFAKQKVGFHPREIQPQLIQSS